MLSGIGAHWWAVTDIGFRRVILLLLVLWLIFSCSHVDEKFVFDPGFTIDSFYMSS